jgi:UrcA family protein
MRFLVLGLMASVTLFVTPAFAQSTDSPRTARVHYSPERLKTERGAHHLRMAVLHTASKVCGGGTTTGDGSVDRSNASCFRDTNAASQLDVERAIATAMTGGPSTMSIVVSAK